MYQKFEKKLINYTVIVPCKQNLLSQGLFLKNLNFIGMESKTFFYKGQNQK